MTPDEHANRLLDGNTHTNGIRGQLVDGAYVSVRHVILGEFKAAIDSRNQRIAELEAALREFLDITVDGLAGGEHTHGPPAICDECGYSIDACNTIAIQRRRIADLEREIGRAHKIIAANYTHQREKVHDGLVILREALTDK